MIECHVMIDQQNNVKVVKLQVKPSVGEVLNRQEVER